MSEKPLPGIVKAEGEDPLFKAGDQVRILTRSPIEIRRMLEARHCVPFTIFY
jgi:hypothetical protein